MVTFREPENGSGQSSADGGLQAEATHHGPLEPCSKLSSQVLCVPGAHGHLFTLGGRGVGRMAFPRLESQYEDTNLTWWVVWEVGNVPNCGSVEYMQVRVKWGEGFQTGFQAFLFTLLPISHSVNLASTSRDICI